LQPDGEGEEKVLVHGHYLIAC